MSIPNNEGNSVTFNQDSCDWFTFNPPASGACRVTSPITLVYTIPGVPNIVNFNPNSEAFSLHNSPAGFAFVNSASGGGPGDISWKITAGQVQNNSVTLYVQEANVIHTTTKHGGGEVALLTFLALAAAFQLFRRLQRRPV